MAEAKNEGKASVRTGGARKRPAGPTAASVDKKVNDLGKTVTTQGTRVDQLDKDVKDVKARYSVDVETLTGRLNGHDRSLKLTGKKHERIERLVADVGRRLTDDHDAIYELTARTTRMEELLENGVRVNLAAAIVGFTHEEVKEILAIKSEEGLSNEDLLTGMVGSISNLKSTLTVVVDTLAETRGIVNDHGERLDGHDEALKGIGGDVTVVASASASAHSRIDAQQTPSWVYAVSAVIGLIAAFAWSFVDFTNKIKVGEKSVIVDNPFANSYWAALMVGIGTAALTAWIIGVFTRQQAANVATADTQALAGVISGQRHQTPPTPPTSSASVFSDPPTQVLQATAGAHAAAGTSN